MSKCSAEGNGLYTVGWSIYTYRILCHSGDNLFKLEHAVTVFNEVMALLDRMIISLKGDIG